MKNRALGASTEVSGKQGKGRRGQARGGRGRVGHGLKPLPGNFALRRGRLVEFAFSSACLRCKRAQKPLSEEVGLRTSRHDSHEGRGGAGRFAHRNRGPRDLCQRAPPVLPRPNAARC